VRETEISAADGRYSPDSLVIKQAAQRVSSDHSSCADNDKLHLFVAMNIHQYCSS
jgi:hypothetical protein